MVIPPEEMPAICDRRSGEPTDRAALEYYAEIVLSQDHWYWKSLGWYRYEQ